MAPKPSPATQEIATHVKQLLPSLWGLRNWTRDDVPCSQPCSLMRADIPRLKEELYYVGAKADGTRAFMLFGRVDGAQYCVLVGRRGDPRVVKVSGEGSKFHQGTLLDGELVKDGNGKETFFVFDMIAGGGSCMTKYTHSARQMYMRYALAALDNTEPNLVVAPKPWFIYSPRITYADVCGSIAPFPCDGVVFVPEHGHIRTGTQRDHLKWKPAHQHTIDLLVSPDMTLWVGDQGETVIATDVLHVHPTLGEVPDVFSPQAPTVVECAFTRTNTSSPWMPSFVRVRPDKKYPNDARTAKLTLQNIQENISIVELLG